MLRNKLESDLATCEKIPQYVRTKLEVDLATCERIPQYAED